MKQTKGFTLVELVVVVAILGILATIAIPSYMEYVEKTQCEDGKALLTNAANHMERERAKSGGKYTSTAMSNFSSSSKMFTVAASGVTATDYTLTASTTAAARISGNLSLTAANAHGGSLTGKCSW